MWTCSTCGRIFQKTQQPHSCQKVPLENHFKNKDLAREIFDLLIQQIQNKIGPCKIISLPCCVHLFGTYDFLAALPKKNHLEVRISLNRVVTTPRLVQSVPLSRQSYKNCFLLHSKEEIDDEFVNWLKESYYQKS